MLREQRIPFRSDDCDGARAEREPFGRNRRERGSAGRQIKEVVRPPTPDSKAPKRKKSRRVLSPIDAPRVRHRTRASLPRLPTRPRRARPWRKLEPSSAKTGTQYFDAARPISPPPRRRATKTTKRAAPEPQSTPFPTMTVSSEVPAGTPTRGPMPSLPPPTTSSGMPVSTPAAVGDDVDLAGCGRDLI